MRGALTTGSRAVRVRPAALKGRGFRLALSLSIGGIAALTAPFAVDIYPALRIGHRERHPPLAGLSRSGEMSMVGRRTIRTCPAFLPRDLAKTPPSWARRQTALTTHNRSSESRNYNKSALKNPEGAGGEHGHARRF